MPAAKKPARNAARKKPTRRTNTPPPICDAPPSRCPHCGSSDRLPYNGTVEHAIVGRTAAGQDYTHVVWRRTACTNCGQARRDRSFENRGGA